ncbi:hypothetical protein, partial [Okeania sp. SIO2B9]|uniref:hypothetical protein n=1 Tax=Okeania sp. SIO2B9 TaxID=2607782 RepID=UPI00142CFC2D
MNRRITLEIDINSSNAIRDVEAISRRFLALQERLRSIDAVAQQLGTSFDDTERFLSALGISANTASRAIAGIQAEQNGLRQVGSTIRELNLTEQQGNILSEVLGNPSDIQNYTRQLNGLNSSLDDLTQISRAVGGSVSDAERLIEELGLSASQTARAIRTIQAENAVGANRRTQIGNLQNLGLNEDQANALLDRTQNRIRGLNQETSSLLSQIGGLAFAFNNVLQSVQIFAAGTSQAYDALIGQNERFRQDVLSTQASLVATSDILRDSVIIEDSTEAILSLAQPLEETIAKIRRDSLELVGVTSSELIPLFRILSTNTQEISNQS